MMYDISKRAVDMAVSLVAVIVLFPIMLLISVAIKVTSPGSLLYRGVRAGRDNQSFHILKFRTMVVDAEKKGGFSTSINDHRFTSIGRFLRRYKLDELPQFFNVIAGHMSLVGPRPQVLYYTDKYVGDEKLILSVRPGITDIASLYFSDMDKTLGSGNVDEKYENEIEPIKNVLRVRYVKERSFFLDIRILIETAFKMIGINNVTGLNTDP